jgi:hypothetical protein
MAERHGAVRYGIDRRHDRPTAECHRRLISTQILQDAIRCLGDDRGWCRLDELGLRGSVAEGHGERQHNIARLTHGRRQRAIRAAAVLYPSHEVLERFAFGSLQRRVECFECLAHVTQQVLFRGRLGFSKEEIEGDHFGPGGA